MSKRYTFHHIKCAKCGELFCSIYGNDKYCLYCQKKESSDNKKECDTTPVQKENTSDFIKADDGKLEWDLMPFNQLEAVVRILMFGAKKYKKDNWKKCDDPIRYQNAAMRHLVAYMKGEKRDPESGESHLAHLICNALFLSWFDEENK